MSVTLMVAMPSARAGFRFTPEVVEEHGLGGRDAERLARQEVEALVGLAHPDDRRLDHGVEQGEDLAQGRVPDAEMGVTKLLVSSPVLKCSCAAPDGLDHVGTQLARAQWRTASRASTRPPAAAASASKASQNASKSSSLRSRRAQALSRWLVAFTRPDEPGRQAVVRS